MSVTLTLSPDEQAALEQRAAAQGVDLNAFIRDALHAKLEQENGTPALVPYHQWRVDFHSWIAGQKSRNPQFDDSRESIYE
jgi:hypothetical protein